MSIRVATFNAENLFARYRFREGRETLAEVGFGINDLAFNLSVEESKRLTAKAIKEVNADILCLQEIENLHVLERFNSKYLGGERYFHRLLIDSHDPRFIDVAVLSRYPFSCIRTHRDERNDANTTWKFSRDCLEVDIKVGPKALSLYLNHFKSMMGGRSATKSRREEQAKRVAAIIDSRWKDKNYGGNFIILGDLNDYPDAGTSLSSLLNHRALVNVVTRLPADERWTHYWAGGNKYSQLDYLLLSRALAHSNQGKPGIMRRGLPYRAEEYTGTRFDTVGHDDPKASDHAPLYMDVDLV